VDDEPQILDAFKRQLRRDFKVDTASGPKQGLMAVREMGPYGVVVSDLRMPKMDGIQFLAGVREANPDTVRIMLTGYADINAAISAINDGNIFRFLTKPCPAEVLVKTLHAGLEQYRLVTSEKELLRGTLRGSIKVLTDILALVNPEAFGRGERIKRHVVRLASKMGLKNVWMFELGAMLSQIGCVSIPGEVLQKKYSGEELTVEEQQVYGMHPSIAVNLLSNIPRLEEIIEMVKCQEDFFSTEKPPPMGARLLKIALDYDELDQSGVEKHDAVAALNKRVGSYDLKVLEALELVAFEEEGYTLRDVAPRDLEPGMVLAADVKTDHGALLLVKGQEITEATIARLDNFRKTYNVEGPIQIMEPLSG